MLSFEKKIHTLSGSQRHQLWTKLKVSKESIFRPPAQNGSLAVEAALVVPLFLFFLLTLLSSMQLLCFSARMQYILFEEGMVISERVCDKDAEDESKVIGEMLTRLNATGNIPVEGGVAGLDFSLSELSDKEFASLCVRYQAKLLFDPFHLFHREFCQHILFHRWIGYEKGLSGRMAGGGETVYVYITEQSEVYHRNRNCTHIRLKIMETTGASLGSQRNIYGEKYGACRHCHPKRSDKTLYITPEGDCYHNSLQCSGLSRTVRAIPLSEIDGRRPCSRCGY